MEWGWRAIHYGQWFHSLHDAKQPFLMWFFGIGQTLFSDPLFGSRIFSAITGLITLWGIWHICISYFDKKTAIYSCLAYISIPFFVFFDRQALMESAVTAAAVWSFYYLTKLHLRPKLLTALTLGCILGIGFFIKNSALLSVLASIAASLYYFKTRRSLPVKIITFSIYSLLAFLFLNLPLLFQSQYWTTLHTNARWTFTLSELAALPISQWMTNFIGNFELIFVHFTPPVFFLCLFGLILLARHKHYYFYPLLIWIVVPLLFFTLTQRFMNFMIFRYLTPLLPLCTIPIGFAIHSKPKLLLPLLIFPGIFSSLLIFHPETFFRLQSRITRYSYTDGYITGFDTGYQVNSIVNYLRTKAKKTPIYVGIAVHSFNPESGIWAYFRKDPRVTVTYFDSRLFDHGFAEKVDCLTSDRPLYFVAKLNDTAGLDKYIQKETTITNSKNSDYSTIYTLKGNCTTNVFHLTLSNPVTH